MRLSTSIPFPRSLPYLLLTLVATGCGSVGGAAEHDAHILRGVAHGEGRFVAVGYDEHVVEDSPGLNTYKTRLMSSTDGLVWTRHDAGLPVSPLQDVAFGNGVFVAVGGDPWIAGGPMPLALVSDDGTTWSEIKPPTTKALRQVLFADGRFLLVADDGQTFTSTDGKLFEPAGKPADGALYRRITFGAGKYVAWGFHPNVFVSSDAKAYTSVAANVDEVNCLHFFQNEFRGVGLVNNGPDEAPNNLRFVLSSPSGEVWSKASGAFPCWGGVVEANGAIISAEDSKIYRSTDGQTFQEAQPSPDAAHAWLDMVVGDGTIVVVGGEAIAKSSDGTAWTTVGLP